MHGVLLAGGVVCAACCADGVQGATVPANMCLLLQLCQPFQVVRCACVVMGAPGSYEGVSGAGCCGM
jgi:hypothetical protein